MTDTSATCYRQKGCPECGQSWPDGSPGYWDASLGGWKTGSPHDHEPAPQPRAVLEAEAAVIAAQARYDQLRAAGEAAEVALRRGRREAMSTPIVATAFGIGRVATQSTKDLEETAKSARVEMDLAGNRVATARAEHHAAQKRHAAWTVSV